jgi:hypothetical protein
MWLISFQIYFSPFIHWKRIIQEIFGLTKRFCSSEFLVLTSTNSIFFSLLRTSTLGYSFFFH